MIIAVDQIIGVDCAARDLRSIFRLVEQGEECRMKKLDLLTAPPNRLMRQSVAISPSIRWALAVYGLTLIGVIVLSSALVFAMTPNARYLVAANVDRIVLEHGCCYGTCRHTS